jgi:hypothetical protein
MLRQWLRQSHPWSIHDHAPNRQNRQILRLGLSAFWERPASFLKGRYNALPVFRDTSNEFVLADDGPLALEAVRLCPNLDLYNLNCQLHPRGTSQCLSGPSRAT